MFMKRVQRWSIKYSLSWLCRIKGYGVIYCSFVCSFILKFILCLQRASDKHNNVSVHLSSIHFSYFMLSREAMLSLWRQYLACNQNSCGSETNYCFPCFVGYLLYIKNTWKSGSIILSFLSFHTFILFILIFFFSFPSSGLLFQPPLFPHQIPSLHNYHLLILNESPNTLHGFNTAC